MHELLDKASGFIGNINDYQQASTVLVGAPMDFTVSFRPGARMGPQQVRLVSYGLEEFSPYLDRVLLDTACYDAGDVSLPFGNVKDSLVRIETVAKKIFDDGKKPLFLGGEHLISYPLIKAAFARYPDLVVIHFDAHADLRSDYAGEHFSHATVMRRVSELVGSGNIYQLGIRSLIKEEFEYAKQHTHLYIDQVLEPLPGILKEIGNRPVYLTLDIDVVDPAFAPGTGTPEPGGCDAREILQCVRLLRSARIIGFDLVEVAPVYDQSERTALLAAKLVRDGLLAFC